MTNQRSRNSSSTSSSAGADSLAPERTRIFRSISEWIEFRKTLLSRTPGSSPPSLGFVPTMGALHEGHLSLIRRSRAENDHTVVSIFVNPTQFNDPNDLKNYPRTLEKDLALLEQEGADFLIAPDDPKELYGDDYRYRVTESAFSRELCGAHRPGHFDGVLTVVMKLLNLAGARRAYFGAKDYQQFLLVKGMAESFFMDVEVVGCPTIREHDGLAMSSRNALLTAEERERAPRLAAILRSARTPAEARRLLTQEGFDVDYVEDHFSRRLGAARLGSVRLIDNVELG